MTEERYTKLLKLGMAETLPRAWFDLPTSGFTQEQLDKALEEQIEKERVYIGQREGIYYFMSNYAK